MIKIKRSTVFPSNLLERINLKRLTNNDQKIRSKFDEFAIFSQKFIGCASSMFN